MSGMTRTVCAQLAVVAVGDPVRSSPHPSFGPECADATREIEWSLNDSTVARIGPASDTSAYVVGTRPGVATLRAEPVAERSAAGAAQIAVVGARPGAGSCATGSW